jgi:flagellin-specific chaperone FliS
MTEYAEAIFEESGRDFKAAREAAIRRAYDQMMLGSARPMAALEALFDTACEIVKLAEEHGRAVQMEKAARDFRIRFAELMRH